MLRLDLDILTEVDRGVMSRRLILWVVRLSCCRLRVCRARIESVTEMRGS